LNFASQRLWTKAEIEIVRAHYPSGGAAECMPFLSGRTKKGLRHCARAHQIRGDGKWTAHDDQRLRINWGARSLDWLAEDLKRTRDAVYLRAEKLKLGLGVPQGLELIGTAAKRCGFSMKTLRSILVLQGVRMFAQPARIRTARDRRTTQTKKRSRFHRMMVDSFDADEAVEKWLTTETVTSAARRRGVNPEKLRRHLLKAGVKPVAKSKVWRVETEVIERVIEGTIGERP
jgi:hypothetical protein